MKKELDESDWITIWNDRADTSVEESWSLLRNKVLELRDRYVPCESNKPS